MDMDEEALQLIFDYNINDSFSQLPTENLDRLLELMQNGCDKKMCTSHVKEILDPRDEGRFELPLLLHLIASFIEKSERRKLAKIENKDRKYGLRPRNCIKKPRRMMYYYI